LFGADVVLHSSLFLKSDKYWNLAEQPAPSGRLLLFFTSIRRTLLLTVNHENYPPQQQGLCTQTYAGKLTENTFQTVRHPGRIAAACGSITGTCLRNAEDSTRPKEFLGIMTQSPGSTRDLPMQREPGWGTFFSNNTRRPAARKPGLDGLRDRSLNLADRGTNRPSIQGAE
jgi:hypothetical protein